MGKEKCKDVKKVGRGQDKDGMEWGRRSVKM